MIIKWLKRILGIDKLEEDLIITQGKLGYYKIKSEKLEKEYSTFKIKSEKEKSKLINTIDELNSMIKSFTSDLPKSKSIKYIDRVISDLNKSLYKKRMKVKLIKGSQELPSPRIDFSAFQDREIKSFINNLNKKYGKQRFFSRTPLNTNSMEPLMDNGHSILLQNLINEEKDKLIVGDIILFDRTSDGQKNVLHRIIKIVIDLKGWYCITRGDNLVYNDQQNGKLTRKSDIKAKCVGIFY